MELCAGAARGAYLVCIGWTTLVVTGEVAKVGQVFIVAMITTLIVGLIIGVVVDRHNRKYLTIVAHLGIASSLMLLGFAVQSNPELSVVWFFATVIVVTFFRNLYQSSHDGLIHANVSKKDLVHVVARFRGVHLVATAVGTVLTGFLIESLSPTGGFILAAMFSVLLVLAVAFVKGVKTRKDTGSVSGFLNDLSEGLKLFKHHRILRDLTILAGVALPIGQLSNAILSSFVHDDLGRGSDVFGIVDAAWPVGGMIAAAILSLGFKRLSATNMEYFFCLLVGIATVVFSLCSTVLSLAVIHAAMGFSVWMCRIVIDGRILQICTEYTVGRTKVFIELMFSLGAMIMCLSPTFVTLPSTSNYFFYWGLIVIFSTALVWLLQLLGRVRSAPS